SRGAGLRELQRRQHPPRDGLPVHDRRRAVRVEPDRPDRVKGRQAGPLRTFLRMRVTGKIIRGQIEAELGQPVPDAVHAAVETLRRRHGDTIAGILFYGSSLRDGRVEGRVLDFYVLVRRYREFHATRLAAASNRLLP